MNVHPKFGMYYPYPKGASDKEKEILKRDIRLRHGKVEEFKPKWDSKLTGGFVTGRHLDILAEHTKAMEKPLEYAAYHQHREDLRYLFGIYMWPAQKQERKTAQRLEADPND